MGTTSRYHSKLKILDNLEKLITLCFKMINIIPPLFHIINGSNCFNVFEISKLFKNFAISNNYGNDLKHQGDRIISKISKKFVLIRFA